MAERTVIYTMKLSLTGICIDYERSFRFLRGTTVSVNTRDVSCRFTAFEGGKDADGLTF